MSFKGVKGDEHMDFSGDKGLDGPRGEPGPYCARTETELVAHLIAVFEQAAGPSGILIRMEDGQNHRIAVDGYALMQAIQALRNYQALLLQPLHEGGEEKMTEERMARVIEAVEKTVLAECGEDDAGACSLTFYTAERWAELLGRCVAEGLREYGRQGRRSR